MSYVFVFALLIAIGFYFSMRRGALFIRACHYLMHYDYGIEMGYDVDKAKQQANIVALRVVLKEDKRKDGELARSYAEQHFGGKQLPAIAEARSMGFLG